MTKNEKKEFDALIKDFQDLLKANGLKITKQRDAILETIFTTKKHFTPEELNRGVAEKFPHLKVGIATIYRTLLLLENKGIVTSISFGANGKKYEYGKKAHHDHMICNDCGKLIEFYDETIENQQIKIAEKNNFKIRTHSMQIYGICEKCQKK